MRRKKWQSFRKGHNGESLGTFWGTPDSLDKEEGKYSENEKFMQEIDTGLKAWISANVDKKEEAPKYYWWQRVELKIKSTDEKYAKANSKAWQNDGAKKFKRIARVGNKVVLTDEPAIGTEKPLKKDLYETKDGKYTVYSPAHLLKPANKDLGQKIYLLFRNQVWDKLGREKTEATYSFESRIMYETDNGDIEKGRWEWNFKIVFDNIDQRDDIDDKNNIVKRKGFVPHIAVISSPKWIPGN